MPSVIPPPPIQSPDTNSFVWLEWYRQLRDFLSQSGSVPWDLVNKAGASIADIPNRAHNLLQSIQGGSVGNYYHLTRALEGSKVFDFPSVASVNVQTTTTTVTGAVAGDKVTVTPSTQLEAGLYIYGYVSATDTITIVASNPTAGAIDPASRTYYVLVQKV